MMGLFRRIINLKKRICSEYKLKFSTNKKKNLMAKAVVRDGRWVNEMGDPLDPVELYQVHAQFNRIYEFTKGRAQLTHSKVELLTHILDITPKQEEVILAILRMEDDELDKII